MSCFVSWLLLPLRTGAVVFNGTDYPVPNDGVTDAQPGLKTLFEAVAGGSGPRSVVFPPGKYLIGLTSISNQIALPSNTTIDATGAQFLFPIYLPTNNAAYPFPLAFSTTDVTNLTWNGGSVLGYGFDLGAVDPSTNVWKPAETPAFLYFSSTDGHGCENIVIQNLSATNLSGPVVAVNGVGSGSVWSATTTTAARRLTITNCTFMQCGLFAWDYSYLLQIICYSNRYSPGQWWMATNYMPPGLLQGPVSTTAGSGWVGFDNPGLVALNTNSSSAQNQCTFYGLPPPSTPQIVAGNPYFVVGTNAHGILVSTSQGGSPVMFNGNSSGSMGLVPNIWAAGVDTYFPFGRSRSVFSGAFCFVDCDGVQVVNSTWSSPGDSSNFLRTANIQLSGNLILPVRMGVLYLGDGCRNAVITNNLFNVGTSGSRIITLETVSNVTVLGNTFIGGGRGCLIVNPLQVTIANNTFRTNTTKAYQDYAIGRIGPEYGGTWEQQWLFNIINDGTFPNGIVITNNLIQTDTAFYFIRFNGYCFTNTVVADNTVYGTRVDGSDASLGPVYNYPAVPPFSLNTVLYNSTIARNSGLELNSDGTYCAVVRSATNQITIPHFLPVVWPSATNGLYLYSGSSYRRPVGYGGTNYLATVTARSPLTPSVSSYTVDATNIQVQFSANLVANTTVTLDWTAQQLLQFGRDGELEDYLSRVSGDGVSLTSRTWVALYGLVDFMRYSIGWNHFIEIYPLWGQGSAYLEKLKIADGEPRLRNLGAAANTEAPFLPTDFGPRGLTGNGLTKSLHTSLTPVSMNFGLAGGISVFVNPLPGSVSAPGAFLMGVDDGLSQYGLQWTGTTVRGYLGGNGVSAGPSTIRWGYPTLYTISRSNLSSLSFYTNGVLAATSTTPISPGSSSRNLRLFASSGPDNNPTNYFGGTLAFAFIDDGTLTSGAYAQLNVAIRNWLKAIAELP